VVSKVLNPILKGKEKNMIKTIFDKKYDEGVATGVAIGVASSEAKWKADALLTSLRAKFKKVPKGVEKAILAMNDTVALNSWIAYAVTCPSMDEFAEAIK